MFITAVTAAELVYGVARLPEGRRKQQLTTTVGLLLQEDFNGRVLPFDGLAAADHADVVATRERAGRPITMADAQIAATCRRWTAGPATRNVAGFDGAGVRVMNPWSVT